MIDDISSLTFTFSNERVAADEMKDNPTSIILQRTKRFQNTHLAQCTAVLFPYSLPVFTQNQENVRIIKFPLYNLKLSGKGCLILVTYSHNNNEVEAHLHHTLTLNTIHIQDL